MVALNYKKRHIRRHPTTRPGIKLLRVQAVVDHATANHGASASNHFTYFDSSLPDLNDKQPEDKKRYASAHIFVDKEEALELVPLDEVCFQANDRRQGPLLSTLRATSPQYPGGNANLLTVSVEMCQEKDGSIHPDTLKRTALVHQMLQNRFPQLKDTYNRFVRHYDVTGKNCPAPMVTRASYYKELLDMTHGVIPINAAPVQPKPKPAPPKKEEPFMLEKAIVINQYSDFPAAELIAGRLRVPIFLRSTATQIQVAKEVIVCGGSKDGLKGNKFVELTGKDRYEAAAAMGKFYKSL
ncbi:N-acetylmuramoyl-L-alanine amidase [Sutcliffiella sp. FSL R7-0096]|uniref:peptidoglycan recognition protein family protein n=1 Tax=Sutcliffiella sp. FSL R7-0096 TaxID=2921670 RepID=UPI003159C45D